MADYLDKLIARGVISDRAAERVRPYVEGVKNFARGGVSEVLKGAGVKLPDWSNRVGDVLQSDSANTALGVMTPLKGAGVRMGIPAASDLREATNANAPIKKYTDALVLNKITPKEFEGFMDALGTHKPHTFKMIKDAKAEREELLQSVWEQLSGMRDEGLIRPEGE